MQGKRISHSPIPRARLFSPNLFSSALCAQPLGCKVISVYTHCSLTCLSWKAQPGGSFGFPGNFLIQIPFDSNSESVSWQGPGLPSSLCSEVRNGGGHPGSPRGLIWGQSCCRPLLCARLITSHPGAFAQSLSRESHTSAASWNSASVGRICPQFPYLQNGNYNSYSSGVKRSFNVFPKFQCIVCTLMSFTMDASYLYHIYLSLINYYL